MVVQFRFVRLPTATAALTHLAQGGVTGRRGQTVRRHATEEYGRGVLAWMSV